MHVKFSDRVENLSSETNNAWRSLLRTSSRGISATRLSASLFPGRHVSFQIKSLACASHMHNPSATFPSAQTEFQKIKEFFYPINNRNSSSSESCMEHSLSVQPAGITVRIMTEALNSRTRIQALPNVLKIGP